jgi:hypothetical protein
VLDIGLTNHVVSEKTKQAFLLFIAAAAAAVAAVLLANASERGQIPT